MQPSEIQELRFSLNLNQDEFAKLLGVSKRSVINYEQGVTTPNPKVLFELNRVKQSATQDQDALLVFNDQQAEYGDQSIEQIMINGFSKLTSLISTNNEKLMKVVTVTGLNVVDIKKQVHAVQQQQESFNRMFRDFIEKTINE